MTSFNIIYIILLLRTRYFYTCELNYISVKDIFDRFIIKHYYSKIYKVKEVQKIKKKV